MGKHIPINPTQLKVGDTVVWVEDPNTPHRCVWDVEVLEIHPHGVIVDAGYGKKALFSPTSKGSGKYVRIVGAMEMDDYLRPKK
jgi:hypothetical protein